LTGEHAPGRKIYPSTEPYIVAHNILNAHAKAVQTYRQNYQKTQNGVIGITLNTDWTEPATNSTADIDASERGQQFFYGWFADPVHFGDYPEIMKHNVAGRLPTFTEAEKTLLKKSYDFLGLNHYSSYMYSNAQPPYDQNWFGDRHVNTYADKKLNTTDMGWPIYPQGLRKLLGWIHKRYNGVPIVITENGCAVYEPDIQKGQRDNQRIQYLSGYISEAQKAITDGVNLKGYFVWSLMDNFEWSYGYTKRFGIHYVDYSTQKRYTKDSALWYAQLIKANALE